jgi:hypothetical protein
VKFSGELRATGGNTTGFRIPDATVEELGGGGRPKVVVTVNGYTFRSSIARMGGEYWLGVSAERRAEAGVKAGDLLDLEIELDTAPRRIEVPDDLAAALEAAGLRPAFDGLAFSHRRQYVTWIGEAKKAETRSRRVAQTVERLRG